MGGAMRVLVKMPCSVHLIKAPCEISRMGHIKLLHLSILLCYFFCQLYTDNFSFSHLTIACCHPCLLRVSLPQIIELLLCNSIQKRPDLFTERLPLIRDADQPY